MDHENFMYLSKKVGRYDQLQIMKENLNDLQAKLVKDEPLEIRVGNYNRWSNSSIQFGDSDTEKLNDSLVKDEYEELIREIKDDLIDCVGMTIVKINQIMEEI